MEENLTKNNNENQNQQENRTAEKQPEKKIVAKEIKFYMKIFLIVVLIGIVAYVYYIVSKANNLAEESEKVIEHAKQYDFIINEIRKERDKCATLLAPSGQETDLGTFKYCEKFIEWSNRFQK